jgi:hypothetical protein
VTRLVVATGILALLCGCAHSVPSGNGESGIQGIVRVGPTCPVEKAESPCPDRPLSTELQVVRGSEVVAIVRSSQDGRFRVALEPGSYTIRSANGGIPSLRPVPVKVRPHAFASVTLTLDSGIR